MTTRAIDLGAPGYPASLAAIRDPPKRLYVRGDVGALAGPSVAVIGTRKASAAGKRCAFTSGSQLALRGIVVVSGLALGIDAEAHLGALAAKGAGTVAVLAHGLHMAYPAGHLTMARDIASGGGALVSEYPDGTPPAPVQFVARARIQAGLARAVVLVESHRHGGSFHTLRYAREMGRPIFAVWSDAPGFSTAGAERARDEFGATVMRSTGELLRNLCEEVLST